MISTFKDLFFFIYITFLASSPTFSENYLVSYLQQMKQIISKNKFGFISLLFYKFRVLF